MSKLLEDIYVLSTYDVEKNSEKKQEGLYIIFLFVIWNLMKSWDHILSILNFLSAYIEKIVYFLKKQIWKTG